MSNFLNELMFQTALAQEAAAPAAGKSVSTFDTMLLPLGFLLILYFLILRPQMKKQKEHTRLMTDLKVGDEVVTQGGMIGKIRSIADQFVTLELSQGANAKVLKSSILQTTQSLITAGKPGEKDAKVPQKAEAK